MSSLSLRPALWLAAVLALAAPVLALAQAPGDADAVAPVAAQASEARAPTAQSADVGVVAGLPAALATGQTLGIGAGYGARLGRNGLLGWGVRAAWSTASEHTLTWAVSHDELRLRGEASLRRSAGRGELFLRLSGGATVLYERRDRHQSARLATDGTTLATTTWAVLPGGELAAGVALRIAGDWGLALAAGPALHRVKGTFEPGWVGSLGVAWLP